MHVIPEHVRRCLLSLKKEMQTKTLLSCYVYPSDWQKSKSLITYSIDKTIGKQAGLSIAGGSILWHNPFGRELCNIYQSPYVKLLLLCNSIFKILSDTCKKCKLTSIRDYSLQPIFHSKRFNTSTMLSLGHWLDRLWHNHTVIYCAAGKKNRKALSIPAWKYLLEVSPSDTREIQTSYTEHAPFA